jgi:hypothetical protein
MPSISSLAGYRNRVHRTAMMACKRMPGQEPVHGDECALTALSARRLSDARSIAGPDVKRQN